MQKNKSTPVDKKAIASLLDAIEPFIEFLRTLEIEPKHDDSGSAKMSRDDILFFASGSWQGAHFSKQDALDLINGYESVQQALLKPERLNAITEEYSKFIKSIDSLLDIYRVWTGDTMTIAFLQKRPMILELYCPGESKNSLIETPLTSEDLKKVELAYRENVEPGGKNHFSVESLDNSSNLKRNLLRLLAMLVLGYSIYSGLSAALNLEPYFSKTFEEKVND